MDCFNYPLDTETLLRKNAPPAQGTAGPKARTRCKNASPSWVVPPPTRWQTSWACFSLQYGIQAEFYQSEYGQYWQDAMFGTPELDGFHPDVIYIHTNWRNIINFPQQRPPRRRKLTPC